MVLWVHGPECAQLTSWQPGNFWQGALSAPCPHCFKTSALPVCPTQHIEIQKFQIVEELFLNQQMLFP